MCRPCGATAPYGRNTFPRGRCVAQRIGILMIAGGNHSLITRRVGRGMATSHKKNAVKAKWCSVKIRTISINFPGFLNISLFLFSHKKWFRKAISCASFPPGEAILRRTAALGGSRPPPFLHHVKQQFIIALLHTLTFLSHPIII